MSPPPKSPPPMSPPRPAGSPLSPLSPARSASSHEPAAPEIRPLQIHRDQRGTLWRAFPHPVAGEVYVITIEPGASRGHHRHPEQGEWFAGLEGDPVLVVERPGTPDAGAPARWTISLRDHRVRVPAGLAHAIFARGSETARVVAGMDAPHDPEKVVPCMVEAP